MPGPPVSGHSRRGSRRARRQAPLVSATWRGSDWGITERIEQWSEHVLQLGQGTLYPALYRLERQNFIRSEWRVTDNNRRARYYSLTARGRRYLNESLAQWRRMSRAINLVLDVTTVN